jgi:hypothetical protein
MPLPASASKTPSPIQAMSARDRVALSLLLKPDAKR